MGRAQPDDRLVRVVLFSPELTSDDRNLDRALDSRLTALALVGLSLEHLGVRLPDNGHDRERVFDIVTSCAEVLWRKALLYARLDKEIHVFVKCHMVITEALSAQAAEPLVIEAVSPGDEKQERTQDTEMAPLDSSEPRRVAHDAGADILFPILVYSIVKSRPPRLISNLRYIQRYRHRDGLDGRTSYVLTNMHAAVSFLQTVDLATLGLESKTTAAPEKSTSTFGNPAAVITGKVANVASDSVKVVTDVVDVLFSRFRR